MNTLDLSRLKGLKIVQMNCRSILNKIDEIRYTFSDVDILSCSETWLNDMIDDRMISMPGMNMFRWDRCNGTSNDVSKKRGGGVACYIKHSLNLDCQLMLPLTYTTCDIELMTLRCTYNYGKKFNMLSIYRPPNGSIEQFFQILSDVIIENSLLDTELWLLGDLNIDFLKRDDPNTRKLFDFLRLTGLKQHILKPTRITGFTKSCIDHIITNIDNSKVSAVGVLNDVISDHYPIFICIKKKRNSTEFRKIKGRTYKNYDKEIFQTLITHENWNPFYVLTNPIDLWNYVLNVIRKHIDIMCPIKCIRIRTNSPPWITQEVIESINDRNHLYSKLRAKTNEGDLSQARRARNRTNKLIFNSKSEYIKTTLDQHKDDPKKIWRILNNTLLKGEGDTSNVVFDIGNNQYSAPNDSCEIINSHFASVGRNLNAQFDTDNVHNTYQNVYNIDTCDNNIVFCVDEVVKLVKDIDVHKSSGIDFLPTFVLKDCFEKIQTQLTYLFNQSLDLGIFPESWAIATITPIPKVGNNHLVNNWRPISIVPLIGKLMEKLCTNLLNKHLGLNDILCDEQYGFRPKRSTSLAIFNYIKNITQEINLKKLVGSIYLDFAKAFDSINHELLICKLKDMGVNRKLVVWIQNYLGNGKIRTKLNDITSSTENLLCGVPQGSILGPTLFLCYINDLALMVRKLRLEVSLFADDAVIFCSNYDQYFIETRLERALKKIVEWCKKNFININISKTKFCVYGTKSRVDEVDISTIGEIGNRISRCHQYCYLGVKLDECLTLKQNYNNVLKKFSYKIYQFGKIKKYIDTSTRILVYKQTVMPLVEYVSFMLSMNTSQELVKLQRLQNRALRMCFNVHDPMATSVNNLHTNARVNLLKTRRDLSLLCVMYDLKQLQLYEHIVDRPTRQGEKYVFHTDIAVVGAYARSPYYLGSKLWNNLPSRIQNVRTKAQFKNELITLWACI